MAPRQDIAIPSLNLVNLSFILCFQFFYKNFDQLFRHAALSKSPKINLDCLDQIFYMYSQKEIEDFLQPSEKLIHPITKCLKI